jgi:hypothetical protein
VLFGGPKTEEVHLIVDNRPLDIEIPAGQLRRIEVPLTRGARDIELAVASRHAFRPADADSQSTDMRRLGCQVRVVLD